MVLTEVLSPGRLMELCEFVAIPVYARGLGLEQAWVLGATGVSEISSEPLKILIEEPFDRGVAHAARHAAA